MIIGLLKLVVYIDKSNSLKDKRMVLHSITKRIRNCFNVSVIQCDHHDKWQKAALAVVSVGRNSALVNSHLSAVCNYIQRNANLEILDYEIELI